MRISDWSSDVCSSDLAAMTDGGGLIERAAVDDQLAAMSAEERPQLRKLGLTIGTLDIFHPQLLKPEAVRWRAALLAAQQGGSIPPLPPHGAVLQKDGDATGLAVAGSSDERRGGKEGSVGVDIGGG